MSVKMQRSSHSSEGVRDVRWVCAGDGHKIPDNIRAYFRKRGPFGLTELDEALEVSRKADLWKRNYPLGHPVRLYIQDALNEGGAFAEQRLKEGYYKKYTASLR